MKQRFVQWIGAFMLNLLVYGMSTAQPYRQLTYHDFTAAVPAGSGFYVAHTSCNVTMNYHVRRQQSNYHLTFDVRLNLNRDRSWINRQIVNTPDMMDEVLRHEQGHYQIAYLMQQEMIRELIRFPYTGNYQRQANDIFNRVDDKYRQMNKDYDEDTQHMQDRKQQLSWMNFLNRQLMQLSELAMND